MEEGCLQARSADQAARLETSCEILAGDGAALLERKKEEPDGA
jgi:hypothetical protein